MCVVTKESNSELYNALFPEDEIKEILDYLKKIAEKDMLGYVKDKLLSYEESKLLLDYITNLQEENQRLIDIIKEVREEMKTAKHISIEDYNEIIKHEKRILEILEKGENNEKSKH